MSIANATFLSVSKLRGYTTTLPFTAQKAITEGKPYWVWSEKDRIYVSHEQPLNKELMPSMRELRRYGEKHIAYREKSPISLPLGPLATKNVGVKPGDYVAIYEQKDRLVLKKATKSEKENITGKANHTPIVDGEIRGGRYMGFTHETRARLGVKPGDYLLVKMTVDNGVWLEISKKPEGSSIPGLSTVLKAYGIKRTAKSFAPLHFTMKYSHNIYLPRLFLNAAKVPEEVERIKLPTWFDGNTLILEGVPQTCRICGKEIRTYKSKAKEVVACASCFTPLEQVRAAITKYGSLETALEADTGEIEKFITDLAVKVDRLTKTKEIR
jgi:bifunctional DNA-binding transcriptional regulator/antitoxin component of YhaV-PrlF toxin-antitoxin module